MPGIHRRRIIPNVTLPNSTIETLDRFLLTLRPFVSRIEIGRQPRTTKEIPRWKAAEFRMILHYLGVFLFKLLKVTIVHFLRTKKLLLS